MLVRVPYCRCSATVTMVRMRAQFVDSVTRHGHNLQTFEQFLRIVLCVYCLNKQRVPPRGKISSRHLAGNNSIIPPTAQTQNQVIVICSCILNSLLLARGSTTTTSKKPLQRALHLRQHHSTMKRDKNWCNAMTSASKIVETMSRSSVRCVHQMAIYMNCNIFLFFFLIAHRNLLPGQHS